MRHLLYVSSSVGHVSDDEIAQILHRARRNNARNGITGMLLYCDGNFLQLLEGEDEAVETTFRRIKRDPHHRDIHVMLDDKNVSQHAFADWSMGFEKLQKASNPEKEAAFEISRMAIERHLEPGEFWVVRRMMETFYEINTRQCLNLTSRPPLRDCAYGGAAAAGR
ncbi:MAG: hypothetical protein GC190_11090 [Alphaproteobacteria bacterium]|nr:hypothetical protein [Alphaproteobacteria bacterium]